MCGRFTLQIDQQVLVDHFHLDHIGDHYRKHYNIAPGQDIAIIRRNVVGERYLHCAHWGLIPSWVREKSIGNKLINARAETITEKPSFRTAFKKRRCIIPADGFYEWRQENGKQPYRITDESGRPLAMAGLWEHWQSPEGKRIESCTIITTQANEEMSWLHNRMPVILQHDAFEPWLNNSGTDIEFARSLLLPYAEALRIYPVSRAVNSPRNDEPNLIDEITPSP
ncbi:MAG: SOS response-associated peptidase [Gammaproteobacteria bacterium]|nr:SOS response-associated peptidase [Gammaproteobacteria bacterium]